jgi:hypothetical protein
MLHVKRGSTGRFCAIFPFLFKLLCASFLFCLTFSKIRLTFYAIQSCTYSALPCKMQQKRLVKLITSLKSKLVEFDNYGN